MYSVGVFVLTWEKDVEKGERRKRKKKEGKRRGKRERESTSTSVFDSLRGVKMLRICFMWGWWEHSPVI